ncbi:hypothetical protein CVT25_011942 [Psilocybe cyanescens]|uniref:GPI-anchored wall transfer protein 1 n=1 Tax=Psilocybe cyanescens TaxID=93625 RepID=A0A409XQU5_PSICY|nr:hypothetical protein CVT25_011942 [Psilocybe cyanescens]
MEGSHNYKQAKEDFVSGTTGSSITHVNFISLVALTSVALYAAIQTRTRKPRTRSGAGAGSGFFASWALLILPMLLAMTLAADYPYVLWLSVLLGGCAAWVLRMPVVERGTPLPSTQSQSRSQPGSPARLGAGAGVAVGTAAGGGGVSGGGGGGGGGGGVPMREREGGEMWTHTHTKMKTKGVRLPPLPALSTYRAHMMLMTVLAILAVDFPVFPRALAKCETFGVSLMDLGVGSFVFSQGVVSAIPLVKDPRYLRAPLLPKLFRVVRKSLPVIALGGVRVLFVKGTEYPEHVTEYGVHWNFFITLAVLPILQVLLHPLLVYLQISISMLGALVAIVQQLALSRFGFGWQDYVLFAPRASLVSMNKEGLVSLLGYLSIQLLGLSAGTIVLPPTPSFFSRRQKALAKALDGAAGVGVGGGGRKRRNSDPVDSDEEEEYTGKTRAKPSKLRQADRDGDVGGGQLDLDLDLDLAAPRQLDKTATELCAYSIVWWALLGMVRLAGVDGGWKQGEGGVSRRMVNLSYILWVAAFNVSFLLCYVVVLDLWIYADAGDASDSDPATSASTKARMQSKRTSAMMKMDDNDNDNPPRLLEVINEYGLYVFLLANVLTGLINLSMSTMYMSDGKAMLVLSVYSMVCCGVPWIISRRKRETEGLGLGVGSEDTKYK